MLDLVFGLSDKIQYVLAASGAIIGVLGLILSLLEHKKDKNLIDGCKNEKDNDIFYKITVFIGILLIIISAIIAWIRYDYRVVPNITGLNVTDAKLLLQSNNLVLDLIDEEYLDFDIVDQTPKEGAYVKKNSVIFGQFLNEEGILVDNLIKADLHLPMKEIKAFIYNGTCQTTVASELIYIKPTELYLIDLKNQFKYTEYIMSSDEMHDEFYIFENIPEGEYKLYVTIPGYRECSIKISLNADMKFDGHWGYWGPYLEQEPLEEYSAFTIYVGKEANNKWHSYEGYTVNLSGENQKFYTELESFTVFAHSGETFDVWIQSPDEDLEWNGSFTISDEKQEEVKLSLNPDGSISRSYVYGE